LLPASCLLVSSLAYSSTQKEKSVHPSKTSANFYLTTWHYSPDDSILHRHHCENLTLHNLHALVLWVKYETETSRFIRTFLTQSLLHTGNFLESMGYQKLAKPIFNYT
jgi:hypothetical protein